MLQNELEGYKIILASGSPRRQQYFKALGLKFEVRLKTIDEIYPEQLKGHEISDYLSELKASIFKDELHPKEILITSDTVVWHNNMSLAKAANNDEAYQMLRRLSNDLHEVITSVTFTTTEKQLTVHGITEVKFKDLSDDEIWFYINTYKPFDKAGAYGIQEWIGLIGIEHIKGGYPNVVGLPTHLVYKTLNEMVA